MKLNWVITTTICNFMNCLGLIITEAFWSAINVWISKPNVLNRRVCGVVNIGCYVVKDIWQNIKSGTFALLYTSYIGDTISAINL